MSVSGDCSGTVPALLLHCSCTVPAPALHPALPCSMPTMPPAPCPPCYMPPAPTPHPTHPGYMPAPPRPPGVSEYRRAPDRAVSEPLWGSLWTAPVDTSRAHPTCPAITGLCYPLNGTRGVQGCGSQQGVSRASMANSILETRPVLTGGRKAVTGQETRPLLTVMARISPY